MHNLSFFTEKQNSSTVLEYTRTTLRFYGVIVIRILILRRIVIIETFLKLTVHLVNMPIVLPPTEIMKS